jgi:hypothetical protein
MKGGDKKEANGLFGGPFKTRWQQELRKEGDYLLMNFLVLCCSYHGLKTIFILLLVCLSYMNGI